MNDHAFPERGSFIQGYMGIEAATRTDIHVSTHHDMFSEDTAVADHGAWTHNRIGPDPHVLSEQGRRVDQGCGVDGSGLGASGMQDWQETNERSVRIVGSNSRFVGHK